MNAKDWLAVFALALMWGCAFFFVELAIPSFSPFTLVFLRVAVAAALMLPLVKTATMAGVIRQRWRVYCFVGFFGSAFPFVCFAWGQRHIDSGLAGLLNALTTIFIFVFALALKRETFNAARAAGIILGVVGVAVLLEPDAGNLKLLGTLAGIIAAISYAISTTFAWGKIRHHPHTENTCGQLLFAAIFLLPLSLLERPWQADITATAAAAVLGLAVFSSFLAYLLYYRLLARAGAVNTMLSLLLVPVVSVALGAVFLGERFGFNFYAGAALIFASLLLIDEKLRRFFRFWR